VTFRARKSAETLPSSAAGEDADAQNRSFRELL